VGRSNGWRCENWRHHGRYRWCRAGRGSGQHRWRCGDGWFDGCRDGWRFVWRIGCCARCSWQGCIRAGQRCAARSWRDPGTDSGRTRPRQGRRSHCARRAGYCDAIRRIVAGAQLEARLAKLGPDAPLATASGANSISLLDTLTTLPGRTKQAAKGVQRQVQVGIADRLRGAADEGLGTQGARLADTVDGLIQARATAAAPLYEQLRRVDFDPPTSMARTVAAADELGAIALARKIATAEERPFTLDVSAPSRWNAGDVDLVKRGLSAMIQKETRPDGTISEVGRALTGLQKRLIDQLDDVTRGQDGRSLYESARRAFSEPSALKTAAELGSRALSRDEASLTAMTRNMDPGELEAFRVGAMEALRAKLGTQSGQTEYMNLWKNKTTQEKLKAIFGNERGYREFASALAKESQIKGIQRVGVGSPTAERLAGQESLDAIPDAVQAAASVKTGNLLGMVQPVVRTAQRWSTPQPVRDQMGRILLSTGPEAAANAAAMRSLIDSSNRSMLLNTELARQYGLLGGNLIGTRVQGGLLGQNAP